jgi:hypothetical protein
MDNNDNTMFGDNNNSNDDSFDFDAFIGSNPLEVGTQKMELLRVIDKPSEIRLTFKQNGREGIASEMFSKTSTEQGWVIGKWLKVFNITKPSGMNKADSFAHVINGLSKCIGEHFTVEVTKAPVGDSLFNAVTQAS